MNTHIILSDVGLNMFGNISPARQKVCSLLTVEKMMMVMLLQLLIRLSIVLNLFLLLYLSLSAGWSLTADTSDPSLPYGRDILNQYFGRDRFSSFCQAQLQLHLS